MPTRKLQVEILGDASSLQRAFGRASDSGSRFGSTLKSVGKYAAFAIGGAALGGLAVTLRQGIGEFTEAAKVTAQTAAVLKSTGGAANVTAKQVDALANEILRYSGVDDEAVKSGENLLLTFTGIRNEVGKGNDIFDQATKVMVDLSVALGQDMKSSAIQLGKALNDPIRGMTALRRVGVSFTDAQTEQVKALLASGKQMEAQKLILRELNKEFGGSARAAGDTLPGKLNILKETFNNLAGDLVGRAVPAVTSFVGFIADKGLPKLEEFFGALGGLIGPAIDKLGESFAAAGPAILGVLEPLGAAVKDNILPVFEALQEIGTRAITAVSDIIRANGPELRRIFENLGQVVSNLAKVILPLLEFAFTKVLPAAIRILIPVLVLVTEALAKISTVVRIVATAIEAVLIPVMNVLLKVGGAVATFIAKTLVAAFDTATPAIRVIAGVLEAVLAPAFDVVSRAADAVRAVFKWYADTAVRLWKNVSDKLPPFLAIITAPFQTLLDVLNALVGAMKAFIDKAGEVIDLASKVTGAIGGIIGKIPGLQSGGPVKRGRAYLVGESGPELFIPGSAGQIIPNLQAPTPAGGVVGGTTVVVNVAGSVTSERDLGETIYNYLLARQRSRGQLGFN